jgi:hypothetical protein
MARLLTPTLRIALVGNTIYSDAAPGTVAGTFVMLNASKQPQFVLTDDADGCFALSGSHLVRGRAALDPGVYVIRVDGRGAGNPAGVFPITVLASVVPDVVVSPAPVSYAASHYLFLGSGPS